MHPNPAFRQASRETNLAFARERSFGLLAVDAGEPGGKSGEKSGERVAGPLLGHIPFLLAADGRTVHAHLVRANPIARCLAQGERPAVLAVSGPDGYVSPDWYEAGDDAVPTWNYVAVHLRGRLRLRPAATLPGHLDALAAQFEQRLLPKPPWRSAKVPERRLQVMMRAILPVELAVNAVDGTWKLNQNRTDEARLNAARHLATGGIGTEAARLAALMRRPPGPVPPRSG